MGKIIKKQPIDVDKLVGKIVKAYHSGYHEVVRVEKRTKELDGTDSPLIYYIKRFTKDFRPFKTSKVEVSDLAYAIVIDFEYTKQYHMENNRRFRELEKIAEKNAYGVRPKAPADHTITPVGG